MTSLVPDKIQRLVLSQKGNVVRTARERARAELAKLGVREGSEIHSFFSEFQIGLFISRSSYEELSDVCEPTPQIWVGTQFVRDVWELPEEFICLTSVQGEGCYLYSNVTESVYDFSLAEREQFLRAPRPVWKGFFEFIEWYLGEE